MINRWIRNLVTFGALAGACLVLPAGNAFAQPQQPKAHEGDHGRHRRGGLLGEALALDSLSPEQRAEITRLVDQRRAASAPVRAATAKTMTELAQQIEQASIDAQALAPSLSVERNAEVAEAAVERDALGRLHAVLTPAQRSELVARLEAEHAQERAGRDRPRRGNFGMGAKLGLTDEQRAEIASNLRAAELGTRAPHAPRPSAERGREALESFRGDGFDPAAMVHTASRGAGLERLAAASVPVLTPAQRATLASELRARASRAPRP
jgi:Spy/CpxP family protein refolding chaperone